MLQSDRLKSHMTALLEQVRGLMMQIEPVQSYSSLSTGICRNAEGVQQCYLKVRHLMTLEGQALTPLPKVDKRAAEQKHHLVKQAEGCTCRGSGSASSEPTISSLQKVHRLAYQPFIPS